MSRSKSEELSSSSGTSNAKKHPPPPPSAANTPRNNTKKSNSQQPKRGSKAPSAAQNSRPTPTGGRYVSLHEEQENYDKQRQHREQLQHKLFVSDFNEHNRRISDLLNNCNRQMRYLTIFLLLVLFFYYGAFCILFYLESGFGRYFERYNYMLICILYTSLTWLLTGVGFLVSQYLYEKIFHRTNYDSYSMRATRRIWALKRILFWLSLATTVIIWVTFGVCWSHDDTASHVSDQHHQNPHERDWFFRYLFYTAMNKCCYYCCFLQAIFIAIYSFSFLSVRKIIEPLVQRMKVMSGY